MEKVSVIVRLAVEAVVEAPEDIAVGQGGRLHAVATVPAKRTGEESVVELVLIDVHVVVGVIVGQVFQLPARIGMRHGPTRRVGRHLPRHVLRQGNIRRQEAEERK